MASTDVPFLDLDAEQRHTSPLTLPHRPGSTLARNLTDGAVGHATRIMRRVKGSFGHCNMWKAQARECQRFYDGHQWDDYDALVMRNAKRPMVVFNETRKVLRSLSGLERMNRTDVRIRSRPLESSTQEDAAGDLATEAIATVDENCDAANERSLSIKDLGNCGMAFFEVHMDFTEDLDGQVMKTRVPWEEMYWDPSARGTGLKDRGWICRKRNIPREEFERRWPKKIQEVDAASAEPPEWSVEKYRLVTPHYSLANQESNPNIDAALGRKDTVAVYQYQEKYQEDVYRLPDPNNPEKLIQFDKDEWKMLQGEFKKEGVEEPEAMRQAQTKYRQFYVANGILLEDAADLPGNYWSIIVATGEWDEEKKMFIGIIPDMMDPQRTKNKSISSALDFYIHNAKGGVVFETGAWKDETRAKEEWSKNNAWIAAEKGMLDRIKPREAARLPDGLPLFFDMSSRAIVDVVGLGPEFFGTAEGELGQQTQQGRMMAALAIFGWFFDEIARFRREEAKVTLAFISDFMTDGQLIEIGGPFHAKTIPLLKSNLPDKYRMQIDESIKHNPNLKSQIWKDLQPMIPSLLRFGAGKFLLYALKFSPMPAQLVEMLWKEAQQQQGQQQQGQGRGKKEDPGLVAAKAQKLQADAQKSIVQARAIDQETKIKTAEVILEAMRLDAETVEKAETAKAETIGILQTLIPGLKGQNVNGNGAPPYANGAENQGQETGGANG